MNNKTRARLIRDNTGTGSTHSTGNDGDDKAVSVSFDARLQYYEVIRKFMDGIANYSMLNNITGWHRSVNGLLNMTAPYMKPSQKDKLVNELDSIEKLIGTTDKRLLTYITMRLNKVTRKLFADASHLMLPQSAEDSEEFDLDQLNAEMDL